MQQSFLSSAQLAALACQLEVAAPKPGNVHRGADFEETNLVDFLLSASVLADQLQRCQHESMGVTIQKCVRATRQWVGSNTNLGMILLLVPMVKVSDRAGDPLTQRRIADYFSSLTLDDGQAVFSAIAEAQPGGLGLSESMDVKQTPGPVDLLEAMSHAANRDAIARQYTNGMQDVFDRGVPWLVEGVERFADISQAIVFAHVRWMAFEPDSLIQRKCGFQTARNAQQMAATAMEILASSKEGSVEPFWKQVGELDFWLRCDGHRRNPGTTADLIAASIYAALYNGLIFPPFGRTAD